jgi:tetratricopeptide (TPR) repeat protein
MRILKLLPVLVVLLLAAVFAQKGVNQFLTMSDAELPKQDFDREIEKYSEAIRRNPKDAKAHTIRGRFFEGQTEYDKAIADFEEAIRLDPKDPEPWNNVAWIAATCLKATFQNGKKGVQYATKACELTGWKQWQSLDTLAAAYAEVGDFANAVKWEEKALEGVAKETTVEMRVLFRRELQSRLDLFKAHKPYHQEAQK